MIIGNYLGPKSNATEEQLAGSPETLRAHAAALAPGTGRTGMSPWGFRWSLGGFKGFLKGVYKGSTMV